MDQTVSGNMLAAKRSAGVVPEMNLWNTFHTGDEASKQGIYPGYETQGSCRRKFITGVSVAPQKALMFSKKIF